MKKKIIFKTFMIILAIIVFVVGLISLCEKNYKILLVQNVKQAIDEKDKNNEITIVDVTNLSNNSEINHQHVLRTKYDNEKHWKECTVCNKKQDIINHSLTKTWALGYESCRAENSYTETCSCGYSNTDYKPCVWDGKTYRSYGNDYIHAKKCSNCSMNIEHKYYLENKLYEVFCEDKKYEYNEDTPFYEKCHSNDGTILNCKQQGICSVCGLSTKKNNHSITIDNNKVLCYMCGEEFGKYSDEKITRDENAPGTYTVEFRVELTNGAKFSRTKGFYDLGWFDQNQQTISEKNSDGTEFVLKTTMKYKSNYKTKQDLTLQFYITISETEFFVNVSYCGMSPDVSEPEITTITTSNGNETLTEWSRTKPITINGIENYCNTVKIKIVEENNEENIIFEGETTVTNGKYSISCIPEIEVGIMGKTYKCIVIDACNNKNEKKFEIAKIDSIAPTPTSKEIINNEWTKEKDFIFVATDTGIGEVQIAFNDEKEYGKTINNGMEFSRNYKFIGDVYRPKELSVMYKDGLENTSIQKIIIDKIDNTSPTIINASFQNNKLSIESNDRHKLLGEGSGVKKYRFMTSNTKLENPSITIENSTEVNANEEIVIPEIYKVKYVYVVAEDRVGNISEVYEFEVPQLILTSQVNLNTADGKGEVTLDWSTYDIQDKYFVIYRKENDETDWETIVTLEEKFNGDTYTDILANDKVSPTTPNINISGNIESNDIKITANSEDKGTKYSYYIEAYDSNNNLLNISN